MTIQHHKNPAYLNLIRSLLPMMSLVFFLCLISHSSNAQYKQIRGYITDPDGHPLVDVAITNKNGYPLGKSNSEGEFIFNYEIPMMGGLPTFNFLLKDYEPTYWIYDKEETNVHITIHKVIKLIYKDITGIVVDENGKPLPKVKIYSKTHNINGNYSSTYSNTQGKFRFTYPINSEKPIKIKFYKKGHKSFYWKYESEFKLRIILAHLPESK